MTCILFLCCFLVAGCGGVSMPKVSMPKLPDLGRDDEPADVTATPRDLLAARLVNPRANPDTPGMTVGKLIEFADRYLACDCAATRFFTRSAMCAARNSADSGSRPRSRFGGESFVVSGNNPTAS